MEIEKICENRDHCLIQGETWGECQKQGSSAEKVRGKLVSGDFKLLKHTCSDFKLRPASKTSPEADCDLTGK